MTPPVKKNIITISQLVSLISIILFLSTLGGWIYDSGRKSYRIEQLESKQKSTEEAVNKLITNFNEQNKLLGEISGKFTILLTIMDSNNSKSGK